MKTKLHHFAYTITPGKLELMIELLQKMGCEMTYRKDVERWCMIGQENNPTRIQIIEEDSQQIPIEKKTSTHIAFLSDSPKEDIEEIEHWAKDRGIEFMQGGWSNEMLWFDLPDVFINFVVEIMHTSVVE